MLNTNTSVTPTAVVKELKRVYLKHFKKDEMTAKKFQVYSTISYYWVIKHFGSWQYALNKANIDSTPKHLRVDEKEIIEELRKVYFTHFENRRMKIDDFALFSKISYNTIKMYFSSWDNALSKAEINCFPMCTKYDEKTIIEELRRVYFKYYENTRMGFGQYIKHATIGASTIWKYFGTWENALNKAEINCSPKIVELLDEKREKILADLHSVKDNNGGLFFTFDFYKERNGLYSKYVIFKVFECKSWEKLLNKELEIYIKRKEKPAKKEPIIYTENQLFDEIKTVWEQFRRRPSYDEFRKNSAIRITVYEKRYSTWTNSIEKFCLQNKSYNSSENGKNFQTSKKMLLDELKKIKGFHNRKTLTLKKYRELGGKYSRDSFKTYFGNWENALKCIGLKPAQTITILPENELLLNELKKIITVLGRNPKPREIEKIGKYPYRYYLQRFGGVSKSLTALGESLESVPE